MGTIAGVAGEEFEALCQVYTVSPSSGIDLSLEILKKTNSRSSGVFKPLNGLKSNSSGAFENVQYNEFTSQGNFISDEEIALNFKLRFNEEVTQSELDLLKSLLCGQSLGENSQQNGVSYGTRRNQLASLREKAQIKRQVELVTVMSVIIVNYIHSKAGNVLSSHTLLSKHLERYYPANYRIHSPKVQSGRNLLVVDIGPLDGRPVILMHPGFFPFVPLPQNIDCLKKLGIRVFSPVRPGYFFTPTMSNDPNEALTDFVEDVASFLMVFNLSGTPVVSQTFGTVASLKLAKLLGPQAPRMVLCSPQYSPKKIQSQVNIYQKGWSQLCRRYPRLVTPAIRLLAKSMNVPEKFQIGYKKTYATSPPDLLLIKNIELRSWYDELVHLILQGNFVGFQNDFITSHEDWPERLTSLDCDIQLLYGAHDPFSNHADIAERLDASGTPFEVIDNFGQNSILFNPEFLFSRVFD